MSSDEDDFSLSGLTQQDPKYQEIQADSSDDGSDNLQLLFESVRKLAGGEVPRFWGGCVWNWYVNITNTVICCYIIRCSCRQGGGAKPIKEVEILWTG